MQGLHNDARERRQPIARDIEAPPGLDAAAVVVAVEVAFRELRGRADGDGARRRELRVAVAGGGIDVERPCRPRAVEPEEDRARAAKPLPLSVMFDVIIGNDCASVMLPVTLIAVSPPMFAAKIALRRLASSLTLTTACAGRANDDAATSALVASSRLKRDMDPPDCSAYFAQPRLRFACRARCPKRSETIVRAAAVTTTTDASPGATGGCVSDAGAYRGAKIASSTESVTKDANVDSTIRLTERSTATP
jgi:hypothetical protein